MRGMDLAVVVTAAAGWGLIACAAPGSGNGGGGSICLTAPDFPGCGGQDATSGGGDTVATDGAGGGDSTGGGGTCQASGALRCQDGELQRCDGGRWLTLQQCALGCEEQACVTDAGCVPEGCSGMQCGDDGCGGSCGVCDEGLACLDGECTTPCVPSCGERECGGDGCGGGCGFCGATETCAAGQCVPAGGCIPDCHLAGTEELRVCGGDGCGGTCGTCGMGQSCSETGSCVEVETCEPVCGTFELECGPDGCGGSCGSCGMGFSCVEGSCTSEECQPDCADRECGADGCGGVCGTCEGEASCDSFGQCAVPCSGSCSGKECGDDGCGGSCGDCDEGLSCIGGVCSPGGATTCSQVLGCVAECGASGCVSACLEGADAGAAQEFLALNDCVVESGCQNSLCVAQNCAAVQAACQYDHTGAATCSEALSCLSTCGSGNTACGIQCMEKSTAKAQEQYTALGLCLSHFCGQAANTTTCGQAAVDDAAKCADYSDACAATQGQR
ncbi:MAG: hypothetical protein H6746_08950 [Deltaproteobacteria bacterium]|nr:hypothetical protein [Deltaproteobacteria bacterium]